MAIFHLEAKVISRSTGRSAVGSAAYRSGEKLRDERLNKFHDYRSKTDVFQSEILLPSGANVVFLDREALWNHVEFCERRKDAQLAREVVISLPRELSPEQNWELAREFVQNTFVSQGMIADVNLHLGHRGQQDQPHVHVMLSLREVVDDGFGLKNRNWNQKGLLESWRKNWADCCNARLAELGHEARIDHRSLAEQGLDLLPQKKMGPKDCSFHSDRTASHQDIARANGEKLMAEPGLVLEAMTAHHSTFSEDDLKRFIHRHTVDAEQFTALYNKVLAEPELLRLTFSRRLTTRGQLKLETQMLVKAQGLSKRGTHGIENITIEKTAYYLFNDEQRDAFNYLVAPRDLALLVGQPGTGKTWVLKEAVAQWQLAGYEVKGMALAGKVAEAMSSDMGIDARTVASFSHAWSQGRDSLDKNTIVVVDEAGLLGARQLHRIIDHVERSDAKLVLVGDPAQLQPIQGGAAFRALNERVGYAQLGNIVRQHVEWQREASCAFAEGEGNVGLFRYLEEGRLHECACPEQALLAMVVDWDNDRRAMPDKSQLMMAYTREDVRVLNDMAREVLIDRGYLERGVPFQVFQEKQAIDGLPFLSKKEQRTVYLAKGDRFMFLRNEYHQLKVKNGTMGEVVAVKPDEISVKLDAAQGEKARIVTFDPKHYNTFDQAYAVSVHKSQGATVDLSYAYLTPQFDRYSMNVAATRHRDDAQFYHAFDHFATLIKAMSQDRGKGISADYLTAGDALALIRKESSLLQRLGDYVAEKGRISPIIRALSDRTHQRVVRQTVPQIAAKLHLELLDLSVAEGDQGQYRQSLVIDKRGYGVVELENGHAKLIPENALNQIQPGQPIEFVRERPGSKGSPLKAIQLCRLTEAQIHLIESKQDKLESHFGLPVNTLVRAGDSGILLGKVSLNEERFAVIKVNDQQAKLVPATWLDKICRQDNHVHLAREIKTSGKEVLTVCPGKEPSLTRQQEQGFEIGER